MKYKGKELDVFKSDENVAFNPSHPMIVWNDSCGPVEALVLAYLPSVPYPVATVTGNRFKHCAEVPKSKTNWEVYQERYGATMKSLDEALEVFNAHTVVPCQFCPARGHCASDVSPESCRETIKEWGEMEAKDET